MVLYLIDLKDYKREQRLKKKFLFDLMNPTLLFTAIQFQKDMLG